MVFNTEVGALLVDEVTSGLVFPAEILQPIGDMSAHAGGLDLRKGTMDEVKLCLTPDSSLNPIPNEPLCIAP